MRVLRRAVTMPAEIIDGKAIAKQIRNEVTRRVKELSKPPGLATVIVGDRPDSATYVRMKHRACEECGLVSFHHALPVSVEQSELIDLLQKLNVDDDVHGVLLQLPLPSHIDEQEVLSRIAIEKDVDGFNPLNIGKLAMKGREPLHMPCTPRGCVELLKRSNIPIQGKKAVVLGRSNIVGLPVALMLLEENATVTICHRATEDMAAETRQADIVIAAVGRAEMVKSDWIKPGAAVIDVGINSVADDTKSRGYRLVGDVDYEDCLQPAGHITPVPGGVGPMTIAMLLDNCVRAAERKLVKAHSTDRGTS